MFVYSEYVCADTLYRSVIVIYCYITPCTGNILYTITYTYHVYIQMVLSVEGAAPDTLQIRRVERLRSPFTPRFQQGRHN